MVRLACTKCDRRGQYRKATLIERYGPDQNTVDLLALISADCPEAAGEQSHRLVRLHLCRPRP